MVFLRNEELTTSNAGTTGGILVTGSNTYPRGRSGTTTLILARKLRAAFAKSGSPLLATQCALKTAASSPLEANINASMSNPFSRTYPKPASPRMGTSCAFNAAISGYPERLDNPNSLAIRFAEIAPVHGGEAGQLQIIARLYAKDVPQNECCHDAVSMLYLCCHANVRTRSPKHERTGHDKGNLLLQSSPI